MKLWSAAMQLLKKDLRLYFRDRTGVLLGFLMPIGLVTVFGFIMTVAFGGGSSMPKASLLVADEDRSESSARFMAELRQAKTVSVEPRPDEEPVTAETVRAKVKDGADHHALIIGKGFGEALAKVEKPPLEMVRDPGREMEDYAIQIGLMQAFLQVSEGKLWPVTMGDAMRQMGMSEDASKRMVGIGKSMQQLISAFASGKDADVREPGAKGSDFDVKSFMTAMVPMTTTDVTPPERPKQLSYQVAQSVAGMSVMMLMFGLMACSTTLLLERDQGTLRRLFVTRMPRPAILLGKYLFCLCIGLLQMSVLLVYGNLLFGVEAFRDPVTLLVLTVTWSACATTFGILVAVWAKSMKQAEGMSTLLILMMAALGGCWFPIQLATLPWYAEVVTRSTITYWAMTSFQGMFWSQQAWTQPGMLLCIGVQWAFTIGGGALALWLFRRRYLSG